jgi:hypothetical protein
VVLRILAEADIDASNIIRTAHSIVSSTLEAFKIQKVGEELELPTGLYTETQKRYIKAAAKDIAGLQQEFIDQSQTLMLMHPASPPEHELL